jgi:hypothetical protein
LGLGFAFVLVDDLTAIGFSLWMIFPLSASNYGRADSASEDFSTLQEFVMCK